MAGEDELTVQKINLPDNPEHTPPEAPQGETVAVARLSTFNPYLKGLTDLAFTDRAIKCQLNLQTNRATTCPSNEVTEPRSAEEV